MILQFYNTFITLEKHDILNTVTRDELDKLQTLDYKTFITIINILNNYEAKII